MRLRFPKLKAKNKFMDKMNTLIKQNLIAVYGWEFNCWIIKKIWNIILKFVNIDLNEYIDGISVINLIMFVIK